MAITWRNVNAPDVGGAAYAAGQAASSIGKGFDRLNALFTDVRNNENANWENQKQLNTDDMIAQLQNQSVDALTGMQDQYQVQALRDQFGAQVDASKLTEIYENSLNKAQMDSVSEKMLGMLNAGQESEADIRKNIMTSPEFLRLDSVEQQKVLGDLNGQYKSRNSLTDEQVRKMNFQKQISDLNFDSRIQQAEADYQQAMASVPASAQIGGSDMDQILNSKDNFQDIILAKSQEDDGWGGDWFAKNGNDLVQLVDEKVGASMEGFGGNREVLARMVGHLIVPDRDGEVTEAQVQTAINRAKGLYDKEMHNSKLRTELTNKHRQNITGLQKSKLTSGQGIINSYYK